MCGLYTRVRFLASASATSQAGDHKRDQLDQMIEDVPGNSTQRQWQSVTPQKNKILPSK